MKRKSIFWLLIVFSLLAWPGSALAQEGKCTPDADFVADVTVPDDTVFSSGESFEKVWRLKNSGDCEWSEGYALEFVRGDKLGAPDSQPLEETVALGEMVDIGVEMKAPEEDGLYTGYWQLVDDEGRAFGDRVYVRIRVTLPDFVLPGAR